MSDDYRDIIDHPHCVSKHRKPMPMHDRAAQFSPFAALVGYEDAVRETARSVEKRRELDEQMQKELNRRLAFLREKLFLKPQVELEYFVPDALKAGGCYEKRLAVVKKISDALQVLILEDDQTIPIAELWSLDGVFFDAIPDDAPSSGFFPD